MPSCRCQRQTPPARDVWSQQGCRDLVGRRGRRYGNVAAMTDQVPDASRRRTKEWALAAVRPFLPSTAAGVQTDHRSGVDKPSWRGRQHALAFVAAIPASIVAVAVAPPGRRWPMVVYTSTLVATLGTSAAYHTLATTPRAQLAMSRADRATVYTLIAGTTTPALMYTTPKRQATAVLAATWAGAALGAAARATGKANKVATLGYVALGWAGTLTGVRAWKTSPAATVLLASGGIAYTAGAVIYAAKKPVLRPATYGYHEAFHTLTLAGFVTHYIGVLMLATKVRRLGVVAGTS